MIYLTEKTLRKAGIRLPPGRDRTLLLHALNESLTDRIGIALFHRLNAAQKDELLTCTTLRQQKAWLDRACPDAAGIAERSARAFLGELRQAAKKERKPNRSLMREVPPLTSPSYMCMIKKQRDSQKKRFRFTKRRTVLRKQNTTTASVPFRSEKHSHT